MMMIVQSCSVIDGETQRNGSRVYLSAWGQSALNFQYENEHGFDVCLLCMKWMLVYAAELLIGDTNVVYLIDQNLK